MALIQPNNIILCRYMCMYVFVFSKVKKASPTQKRGLPTKKRLKTLHVRHVHITCVNTAHTTDAWRTGHVRIIFICRNRKGCNVGGAETLSRNRVHFEVGGRNMTWFQYEWWRLTWFSYADQPWLDFCVTIDGLGYFVGGQNLLVFFCGRKCCGLSAGINSPGLCGWL